MMLSLFEKITSSLSKPFRLGPFALRAPLAAPFDAAGLPWEEVFDEEAFDEEALVLLPLDAEPAANAAPAHPNDSAVTITTRAFVMDISLVIPSWAQNGLRFPGNSEFIDLIPNTGPVLYFGARHICCTRAALNLCF
jgi:hypothetical protein